MTRKGPAATADGHTADGRLANARAHREAAEKLLGLLPEGANPNAVRSLVVLAAIAYADALTARFGGAINRKDYAALTRTLRDALGNRLPAARERDLAMILSEKDEIHYGARIGRRAEAEAASERLRQFGDWAENMLLGARR